MKFKRKQDIKHKIEPKRVLVVYGPRRVGKTTLLNEYIKRWDRFNIECVTGLENTKDKLQRNDIIGFENELRGYLKTLSTTEGKLNAYIKDVVEKARINKASRLYEHGISIGRTADMLGINKYELMDYIGKTYIADVKENKTLSVKKRLEIARRIFS